MVHHRRSSSSLHSRRNPGLPRPNEQHDQVDGDGLLFLLFQGNIFLRSADLSCNGFGKEGAVALGQALRENEVLEELNVRYRLGPAATRPTMWRIDTLLRLL